MNFYNIIWLMIFITGGITLGILGLSNIHYFSVLVINPAVIDSVLFRMEKIYLEHAGIRIMPQAVLLNRA